MLLHDACMTHDIADHAHDVADGVIIEINPLVLLKLCSRVNNVAVHIFPFIT